jgi:long-chain acyl-CoA synthetase
MTEHIAHMVRDRASRYGSREVFRYREQTGGSFRSFSWNEFRNTADKVSKALLALGFGKGSPIGIFSDNRLEWTLSDVGILGIRGVVVPFFGTASGAQVKYIVDETEMQLIFTGNKEQMEKALGLFDGITSLKKIVIYQSDIVPDDDRCVSWEDFLKLGEDPALEAKLETIFSEARPTDLATILYTSGTTGEPKGVMLHHDNFMEAFKLHIDRVKVLESDVSMCFLPLSHVFERTWSFYIMYSGAVNVYLNNPREVIETLPIANPTLMCTVPRFFEKTYDGIIAESQKWPSVKQKIFNWAISTGHRYSEYRRHDKSTPAGLKIQRSIADKLVLKKLRNIFGKNIRMMPCAGAAIREDLLRFFHATGLFVNFGYGATETTATVSCYRADRYEFGTVGEVMPNVSVKITDNGEIMVKGPNVFKGYYKKPEATAEALKDGWYMTGDKGHFSPDGNLVMTDRIKDMFKTSVGKYISPQKIELLLGRDTLIEQIVAIGDNRHYITALIVPSFENLRAHLKQFKLDHLNNDHIVNHEKIRQLFHERIEKIQEELTSYEKVKKFILLPESFSIENSAMTSTLKLRRKVITEKYRDLIERMYSAG